MKQRNWLKEQCYMLWKEAFGDNDEFIADFLTHYFNEDNFLYVEQDGRILSMLHIIPFELNEESVAYIYAVATAKEARGKGLATKLMKRAIAKAKADGYKAVATLPADEGLHAFYAGFGFKERYAVKFTTPDGFDFGTGNTENDIITVLTLDCRFEIQERMWRLEFKA